MKIGLVLEGGGMRAMFSAGVLDVLIEQQLAVNGIVSVSAGALFGVNLPSKQKGRVLRYNQKYLHDKRYMGWHSLLTTGNIVNKDFAFYEMPMKLDPFDQAAFVQAHIDFWLTLTNVETGEAEYVKIDNVFEQMEYFRASSAMPLVSKIVEINGKKYLDGGIADSIPIQKCFDLGYDKVIAVLTQPENYRKSPSAVLPFKLAYHRYPKFVECWAKRYATYNQTVEKIQQLEQENRLFVIRPTQKLTISRVEKDFAKIQAMYDLGVQDANAKMAELTAWLVKNQ
ncbi:patatin family protein [Pasteurellaceae bacterium Pebbles2]|nr:patatin family protein [Pasteurellaceae bacterium Pebbles2]